MTFHFPDLWVRSFIKDVTYLPYSVSVKLWVRDIKNHLIFHNDNASG